MELIQYPQEARGAEIARAIAALENTAWPDDTGGQMFPTAPGTYAASFVLMEGERAICHVGIRKSALHHKGEPYAAYGLSEVVTHPQYQNRGFASQTVKRAAQFILSQQADISIFTCARERVAFYARGGWEAPPGACLVGGTEERPFRSDSLGLVTMMMFISPKSRRHRADFENADIFLPLGENQLW